MSDVITDWLAQQGFEVVLIAGQAAWKNGIVERAQGVVKSVLLKQLDQDQKALDDGKVGFEEILEMVIEAKNEWPGDARVLGKVRWKC